VRRAPRTPEQIAEHDQYLMVHYEQEGPEACAGALGISANLVRQQASRLKLRYRNPYHSKQRQAYLADRTRPPNRNEIRRLAMSGRW